MVTHNRPEYTRLSLERLLESATGDTRVWLWHNGTDQETLAEVESHVDHPRVHRFHHSPENVKLRDPTNWILREGDSQFVAKVDDDCLVPDRWIEILSRAHEDEPAFGVLGCWHFMEEDVDEEAVASKLREFRGGHRVMWHPWVGGSGFLMKRECVDRVGELRDRESAITDYMIRIAFAGWTNGWYYPFLWQEHMDDPRSPHTLLKTDADLQRYAPLSVWMSGARTIEAWEQQMRDSAALLQQLPSGNSYYYPWRRSLRRFFLRLRR